MYEASYSFEKVISLHVYSMCTSQPQPCLAVNDDEEGQKEARERSAPAQALDRVPEEERQRHFEPHVSGTKQEVPIRRGGLSVVRAMMLLGHLNSGFVWDQALPKI